MRKLGSIAALVALFALSAVPVSAATGGGGGGGSGGVTIGITKVTLQAKLLVTVAFDVVCSPVPSPVNPGGVTAATYGASVTVDQAVGKTIAHAAGGDTMPSSQPLTCDGTTVNHVSISALSSTVPFKAKTNAVIGVSVTTYDPACEFCGGEGSATIQVVTKL